ncbi:hypothetical protein Bbelb_001400 [Branchiostoma belcheri]|nr:hypothetical protein Bbelb_001400 [Branchiostoma belcheri]
MSEKARLTYFKDEAGASPSVSCWGSQVSRYTCAGDWRYVMQLIAYLSSKGREGHGQEIDQSRLPDILTNTNHLPFKTHKDTESDTTINDNANDQGYINELFLKLVLGGWGRWTLSVDLRDRLNSSRPRRTLADLAPDLLRTMFMVGESPVVFGDRRPFSAKCDRGFIPDHSGEAGPTVVSLGKALNLLPHLTQTRPLCFGTAFLQKSGGEQTRKKRTDWGQVLPKDKAGKEADLFNGWQVSREATRPRTGADNGEIRSSPRPWRSPTRLRGLTDSVI